MPISAETFYLPPGGGTLQQRIQAMLAEAILSGRLRSGEKLPSSRGLAADLGVSRITVTLAYTELVASDYLSARDRSGYYVSDSAPQRPDFGARQMVREGRVDWGRAISQPFSRLDLVSKPADWRRYHYPFIYGQADPGLFDHQNWRSCAVRALGLRDFEALTADYHERDDPMLIEYIVRRILPRRGIHARPAEVLLSMGAQNALWLAAAVLLSAGRVAAREQPCYPGLRSILTLSECRVVEVAVDEAGMPPEALPDGVDVVFTTASHQCPTNATMPVERRAALLARAAAENFLIVEDDYEFEMSFLKAVSPSLKSLDRDGRVIYAGSFSKSLFPGLRLGYLVGPEPFIREARALRATVLRHPPGHIQRTAAYFLSLGHYDAQINRMKAAFKRRRALMQDAIRSEGLEMAGRGEFGGSSFWMRAPEGVDSAELAQVLRRSQVLIEPGRVFFGPVGAPLNYYRLAYSSIATARIAEGIGLIARAIRAE